MMYSNKLVCSIKTNGKIMREQGDTVFLPFGSDYSIYLKNLNTVKAEVNISIDGEDILDGNSLIVEPGKSVDIGRWLLNGDLSKGPKLRFIEKTDTIRETKEETGMDGLVEITYQFEKIWPIVYDYNTNLTLYRSYTPPNVYGGSFGSASPTSSAPSTLSAAVGSACSNQALYSSTVNHVDADQGEVYSASASLNEEGMTVKGQEVKQEFSYAHIGQLDGVKHAIVLHLKGDTNQGKVQQPLLVKTKAVCSVCKKKQSSNNKFCVSCGNNMKY